MREPTSGGVAVVGVVNCGHTGRLNQFVEQGANSGALTIICGGGSRSKFSIKSNDSSDSDSEIIVSGRLRAYILIGLNRTGHMSFLTRQDRTPKFAG